MKDKLRSIYESTKLNLTLFKIWLMKNIVMIIQLSAIVLAILTFAGVMNITSINILSKTLNDLYRDVNIETLMSALGSIATLFVSIGFISSKAKSIALDDLKSDKVKIALLKANLYFDKEGRLRKRVEDEVEIGDPKINSSNIIHNISEAKNDAKVMLNEEYDGSESTIEEVDITKKVEMLLDEDNKIEITKPEEYPVEDLDIIVNKNGILSYIIKFLKDMGKCLIKGFKLFKKFTLKLWKRKDKENELVELDAEITSKDAVTEHVVEDTVLEKTSSDIVEPVNLDDAEDVKIESNIELVEKEDDIQPEINIKTVEVVEIPENPEPKPVVNDQPTQTRNRTLERLNRK